MFLKHLDVLFIFHTKIVLITPNWGAKVLNSKELLMGGGGGWWDQKYARKYAARYDETGWNITDTVIISQHDISLYSIIMAIKTSS